ncbi:hypothetical protein FK220_013980 [Flavobacteriaceae bacterium TP-CH-4]|uniref:Uncharacterized protein n=2 Tax=Pelagihabitans pacificus TaxID=2696054 RepID=A0A967AUY0_9FLAO|nr:hypothetical protein [Pelagihabitans pacificus]
MLFLAAFAICEAQEMPIQYTLGENYSDRYKFSTVLSISAGSAEKTVLIRTYYGGMPLRPKGHFIELYDADMNLERDYNYKYAGEHMVDGFVRNGQLYLLELKYDWNKEAYDYIVHQSPLHEFNFTERTLLSVPSKEVLNPLAANKYHRNFKNGFSTSTFFNDERTAFAITVHHRQGKEEKYTIYLFGTDLKKHLSYDFSGQIAEKNYAFENIEISKDLKTIYLMGKAYFKKRRFDAKERRFQYELVRLDNNGHRIQEFADTGRFPEALKPLLVDGQLTAVGFYADRKDRRYNGLVYYKLDAQNLDIQSKKYNLFSNQFMLDKFGREVDAEIKNLIFKDVHITPNKDILFSAEEYFVTTGTDISEGHTRKVQNYHYNDIVCAKLDANGNMVWARNINKNEVTRGDESYASYSAFGKDGEMYFFINSGEHPQTLGKNRIVFKQGYSKNPNMFVIRLNGQGEMDYRKLIDDKEVRLPIMVSRPLIDKTANQLLFYAKRGSKKQLIKVRFGGATKISEGK